MRFSLPFLPRRPTVPVIRLNGVIAASGRVGSVLNDAGLATTIERAFARGRPVAVALVINSPGGSPVQSALIAARIRRLADEHKLPVHAFVEDIAASGGYWLASTADSIWVDDTSIVGSIGVISAGFGFPDFLARYGVERRVHTAGKSKSLLDPFRPEKPEDVARLRGILDELHRVFIAQVQTRRGERLDATETLFEGDVWVGAQAVRVGLADGVGHLVPKMKELFGDKVRLVPFAQRRPLFARLGAAAADAALERIEDRALWARYGM